jgi:signal transduction histidine kinase
MGAAALLLAETVLIAGLLIHRKQRRLAEEKVRGSQEELRTSYERIRDLAARLIDAQDSERSRIARELHDDVSQQIALLSIDLEILAADPLQSEAFMVEVLERTQSIARSVHDLSHRLHPAKLRLIGLVPAVQALQRESSRSGVDIEFTHEDVPPVLPPDLTLGLFRVIQEALQNALKYSDARTVTIGVRGGPQTLAVAISDNGRGFDVDACWGKGLGLVSIRERIDAVGGTLDIRSTPGMGTSLWVDVPLSAWDAEGLARAGATGPRADSA